MNETVGFDELCWLRELSLKKQKLPDLIGARLVTRGLIERTAMAGGFTLTARGRIALTKLG